MWLPYTGRVVVVVSDPVDDHGTSSSVQSYDPGRVVSCRS
jgi:hypothetical protein